MCLNRTCSIEWNSNEAGAINALGLVLNSFLCIFRLSDCSITEEGYKTLASSLKSNSNLVELDLTGNRPGKSGVQDLIDLMRGGCCKLKIVR